MQKRKSHKVVDHNKIRWDILNKVNTNSDYGEFDEIRKNIKNVRIKQDE